MPGRSNEPAAKLDDNFACFLTSFAATGYLRACYEYFTLWHTSPEGRALANCNAANPRGEAACHSCRGSRAQVCHPHRPRKLMTPIAPSRQGVTSMSKAASEFPSCRARRWTPRTARPASFSQDWCASGSCGRARAQSLVSGPSAGWSSTTARSCPGSNSYGLSRTHGENPLDPGLSNGYRKASCRSPQARGSSRTQGARPTTDGSSWCTRARAATAACFGSSARPPRSATRGSAPSVARSRRKRRAPAQRP